MTDEIECPRCAFRFRLADGDEPTVEQLERACRERGLTVTVDGRVSESTTAMLVGRAPGTLRNWRNGAGPVLRHYKMHGRYTYRLTDIAAYLAASRAADF
jgi:hypothetical protein